MREIRLKRKKGVKLGFSIRGGKEHGIGIFVSDVENGSEAELHGLKVGDEIIRVNGFSLDHAVHSEVINLFKNNNNLVLTVRNLGVVPVKDEPSSPLEEPQTPPFTLPDHQNTPSHKQDPLTWKPVGTEPPITAISRTKKASISDSIEMKLFIDLTDHQELGCTICKGPTNHPGIYIQSVKIPSVAYEVGLQAGDQIIEVNQFLFNQVEFQTAVKHLKAHKQLELVIKKGSGRDFIPAESSGYNSSSSSVNEDGTAEESNKFKPPKGSKENGNESSYHTNSVQDNNNNDDNIQSKRQSISSNGSTRTVSSSKSENFEPAPENEGSSQHEPSDDYVPTEKLRQLSVDSSCDSIGNYSDLTADLIVEEIRQAAQDELNKDSCCWEKSEETPLFRDQEVQTSDVDKESTASSSGSEGDRSQKSGPRLNQIWQRTVIAEVHNNPLPAPPPLPKEHVVEVKVVPEEEESKKKTRDRLLSMGDSKTIPSKVAEEVQKRLQHDQLIEEFKQVQRAMQNVRNGNLDADKIEIESSSRVVEKRETTTIIYKNENNHVSNTTAKEPFFLASDATDSGSKSYKNPDIPAAKNSVTNAFVNQQQPKPTEIESRISCLRKTFLNGQHESQETKSEPKTNDHQGVANITDSRQGQSKPPSFFFNQMDPKPPTRRGPLVTIGTYADSTSRAAPNRLSFLNGRSLPGSRVEEPPPRQRPSQGPSASVNTSYTTVIQNGPTKSTAVIETNSRPHLKAPTPGPLSDVDRNKVTIRVPAASLPSVRALSQDFNAKDTENQFKNRPKSLTKRLSFDDVPIIIEDLPQISIEVKDFNPRKLFTDSQISGRDIKMYSMPRANPLDIQIEGGLGSPLNGKIIVARVIEGSEIYKHGVIDKGDQLMWVNGHSFLDITLSQAQGALRSAAKVPNDPLKIIVAKAHPGLYNDVCNGN